MCSRSRGIVQANSGLFLGTEGHNTDIVEKASESIFQGLNTKAVGNIFARKKPVAV